MRYVLSIPYIIMFSLCMAPAVTTAVAAASQFPSKKVEWNNFDAHSILQKRNPSQGYMPKIGGSLEAVGDFTAEDLTGLRGGLHIAFPWTTLVVSGDLQGLLVEDCIEENDNVVGGFELNVIIGDLNRFPLYIQCGFLNPTIGRHASELLPTSSVVTRQAFYNIVRGSMYVGTKVGGYYSFNDYGEVKANGFWNFDHSGQGINVQYDLIRSGIHFLVGGGYSEFVEHSATFDNLYTEVSGQETILNNQVKGKFEILRGKNAVKQSFTVLHTEASYHMPLYYFGNPSAVVVGYSALGARDVSYGFGGAKVNCFKYVDLIAGMTYGKVRPNSDGGFNPLLQLQFSL